MCNGMDRMMKKPWVRRAMLLAVGWGVFQQSATLCNAAKAPDRTFYSFSLVKRDGTTQALSTYKGKVVVLVNLASHSSFADQLPALNKLAQDGEAQGLVVIGIPSNDFGAEEPGDAGETAKWYAAQHVTFPVMAKGSVCGKDELPLYAFLTEQRKKPGAPGSDEPEEQNSGKDEVHWSYTKFIVTREGQVGARFEPDVAPDSPEFQIAIQKALASKLKPGTVPAVKGAPPQGSNDEDDGGS